MSERRVRTLDAPARFVTKDMVMCVVVLAVIALVAGVLLGLVNWLTYVDPAAAVAEQVAEHYGVDPSLVSSAEDRAMSAPGASSTVDAAYVVSRELDLNAITDYGDVGSSAVRDEGVYITGATYTSKSLVNAVRALAYAFAAASGEVTP